MPSHSRNKLHARRPRRPIKTLGACFVALALSSVALAACGSSDDNASTTTQASSTGGDAKPLAGKHLVYVASNYTGYNTIGCGAKAEAEALGGSLQQQNAKEFTAASQAPIINAAVASNPDALIASPTDPVGLFAAIKAASERMPVATIFNNLKDRSPVSTEVNFDNVQAGRDAAKYLAEQADGKPVKVAAFSFTPGGSLAADDEVKGFEAQIKTYPNITYLGPQYAGAQDTIGATTAKLNAVLSANPDLFGVFTHAQDTGAGALASLRQRKSKALLVANYSTTEPALVKALKEGEVSAIVDFPYGKAGKAVVDQLANKLTDKPVEASISFPPVTYTKDSSNDPTLAADLNPKSTC